jgi:hypothetical protein
VLKQLARGPQLAVQSILIEHLKKSLIGWQLRKRRPTPPLSESVECLRAAHPQLIETQLS